MRKKVAWLIAVIIGVGSFWLLTTSPAEGILANNLLLLNFNPYGIVTWIVTNSWVISMFVGFLIMIPARSIAASCCKAKEDPGAGDMELPDPNENTLYSRLQARVMDFAKVLRNRSATKDYRRLTTISDAPLEDYEEIYNRRKQNVEFLDMIITNLCRQESLPPKDYQSGERPELLVAEVRELLRRTLYERLYDFHNQIRIDEASKEPVEWQEFETAVKLIGSCCRGLKASFEFYLDMCRNEKNKFAKFNDYGVLPLDVGEPDGPDLYLLISDKKLGENYPYDNLLGFKDKAPEMQVPFNPSIPDAFDIFDAWVIKLHGTINYYMSRAKGLFTVYQFTRSEAYTRIRWIADNLTKLKPESVDYYLDGLSRYRREYDALKSQFELTILPAGVLSHEDIDVIHDRLEQIGKQQSQVVYKTDTQIRDSGPQT